MKDEWKVVYTPNAILPYGIYTEINRDHDRHKVYWVVYTEMYPTKELAEAAAAEMNDNEIDDNKTYYRYDQDWFKINDKIRRWMRVYPFPMGIFFYFDHPRISDKWTVSQLAIDWWHGLSKGAKSHIRRKLESDKEIFREITGIDINKD